MIRETVSDLASLETLALGAMMVRQLAVGVELPLGPGSEMPLASAMLSDQPWDEAVSTSDPEVSFAALYQQHSPAVYRFSLCISGDPAVAEELTAEAFCRAWVRRDIITQSTMRSYLFTIAKNVYRDQLRRTKRQVALTSDYMDGSPTAAEKVERSEESLLLRELLDTLTDLDREIIALRYQEELSHEEIASILGMSAASVRIRAHRARRKLLEAYAKKVAKP
jgi:RNA polymerase sigma-70 factor (ECF subfamily)